MSVAIVTGGASGIGWAIAERLLDAEWDVSVIDSGTETLSALPLRERPRLRAHRADVRDADAVEEVVREVVSTRGRLDLLVNNAGISAPAPIVDMTEAQWRQVIDVNLTGAFLCLRAAGRVMLEQGSGAVVNIASVAAERGHVGRSPYCASKAGIMALTRAAAAEWGPQGIRVNAIAPGYIDTPMYQGLVAEGRIDETAVVSTIPMGHLGTGADVAAAVEWIGSSEARYVTGPTLFVDGGFLVDYPPSRAAAKQAANLDA
jgi:3-oxoacyl-[acyl-carrier protein] reductase